MSLNRAEREQTRLELQHNLKLSGWSDERLAAALGVQVERVREALAVATPDPADVWLVRDALDAAVRAAGLEPGAYSRLTEENRASAQRWFGIRPENEVTALVRRSVAGDRSADAV
ncbi:DUF2316 family protein [Humibacter ginsenosidimutans]|uniref:DUF2316 family protein n=1 Tax=Humibacter ginsenosidimutans TaxID=2599293 RepID=A0A5B8M580_9MICO|nr:DUF2316 family protein [Humibacter ginsenosidimutans]QDZ15219.1 DUF2316 family protein [Humibacter ginsenosidimutans]